MRKKIECRDQTEEREAWHKGGRSVRRNERQKIDLRDGNRGSGTKN